MGLDGTLQSKEDPNHSMLSVKHYNNLQQNDLQLIAIYKTKPNSILPRATVKIPDGFSGVILP